MAFEFLYILANQKIEIYVRHALSNSSIMHMCSYCINACFRYNVFTVLLFEKVLMKAMSSLKSQQGFFFCHCPRLSYFHLYVMVHIVISTLTYWLLNLQELYVSTCKYVRTPSSKKKSKYVLRMFVTRGYCWTERIHMEIPVVPTEL